MTRGNRPTTGCTLLVALCTKPGTWAFLGTWVGAAMLHADGDTTWTLAILAAVGATVWHRWRTRWSFPARVRTALIGLGCVQRRDDGTLVIPRLVGRPATTGAVTTLTWRLPLGVTAADVAGRVPALEEHLDAGVSAWADGPFCVMTCARARVPAYVGFDTVYGAERPPTGCWLAIGVGRRGPVWVDLDACPHLLVGGMTGGGKSVFLRQVCTGLALGYGPDAVRFAAVDLKGGVDLAPLGTLPHAIGPVADTVEAAADLVAAVAAELTRRLAALRTAGIPDVAIWADMTGERPPWPRLVVVVDELAEATCPGGLADRDARAAQQAVAGGLAALARLGRAAGVHLLCATQRPDADAVPGQLKANLTGIVAFRVRSAVNSWILVESDRAAQLPPHPGRALWVQDGVEMVQVVACDRAESTARMADRWGAPASAGPVSPRMQNTSASSTGVVG